MRARRAARRTEHGRQHILGFDSVRAPELPASEDLADRAAEPSQQIHLVDRLVDQRSATFGAPAALDRTRIVVVRPVPLHVGIELQRRAEPPGVERGFQKPARLVEPMLADDAEQDAGAARRVDHLPRGVECRRHRLLHLNMLAATPRMLRRLEPEVRQRADVDVVDRGMTADVFVAGADLAAMFGREPARGVGNDIGADDDR